MSVKSRSKTFKPGDDIQDVANFFHDEIKGASEEVDIPAEPGIFNVPSSEHIVKKRLIITITYDRDDKTE